MTHPINIAITSHNLADADAFGEFVAAAAREHGFKDVSIDSASNSEFSEAQQAVIAMRSLNPNLFNAPVIITTDIPDDTPPAADDPVEDEPY